MRVPFSPHGRQLLSPFFLVIAIPAGVKGALPVVLICVSLMTSEVEHLLTDRPTARMSSPESIQTLCSCSNWVLCFLLLSGRSSSHSLDINPLSDIRNILSRSVGCLFTLLVFSSAAQELFRWMEIHVSVLLLWPVCCLPSNHLLPHPSRLLFSPFHKSYHLLP